MKRQKLQLLVVIGGVFWAAVALVVTVSAGQSLPAEPPNMGAAYSGSASCVNCHNTDDAKLWDAWSATAHAWTVRPADEESVLGDFSTEGAPSMVWPDGEERPLAIQDITLVIGGRYIQRYVSVVEQAGGQRSYFVLPVVWNIPQTEDQSGTWTVLEDDAWTLPENDWRVTCAGCHTTNWNIEAVESDADFEFAANWQRGDVELGVGCEACHGPAGEHRGKAGTLVSTPDAQVCAQCHSMGQDAAGMHPFPVDYQPGLSFEDTVFVLSSMDDETVWWPTGHARQTNAQYNEWSPGAHASALSTLQASALAEAWCLACHSVPQDTTDPMPELHARSVTDAAYGITCVTCHNVHPADSRPSVPYDPVSETNQDDKRPHNPLDVSEGKYFMYVPGAQYGEDTGARFLLQSDTYTLCVNCHNSTLPDGETMAVGGVVHHPVQEMFEGAAVIEAVAGMPSIHFASENGPRCITCHMPRTIQVGEYGFAASHRFTLAMPAEAGDGQPDSCSECHEALQPTDLQYLIEDTQQAVLRRVTTAWARVDSLGVVATGTPERDQYDQVLLALNFIQNDGSLGVHNFAYVNALLMFSEQTLRELSVSPSGEVEMPVPTAVPAEPMVIHTGEFEIEGGAQVITYVLMGVTLLILLIAAFAFFGPFGDKGGDREGTNA